MRSITTKTNRNHELMNICLTFIFLYFVENVSRKSRIRKNLIMNFFVAFTFEMKKKITYVKIEFDCKIIFSLFKNEFKINLTKQELTIASRTH